LSWDGSREDEEEDTAEGDESTRELKLSLEDEGVVVVVGEDSRGV